MAILSGVCRWLGYRPFDFYASDPRMPVSLRKLPEDFQRLPDELKEKIVPRENLIRDILEFRHSGTPEERGAQLLRLNLLKHHRVKDTNDRNNDLLRQSLQLKYKPLFKTLLAITPEPDLPLLIGKALQTRNNHALKMLAEKVELPSPEAFRLTLSTRNDAAFKILLDTINKPLPPEDFRAISQQLADYGQPDKLKQLMIRQLDCGMSRPRRLYTAALQWLAESGPDRLKPWVKTLPDSCPPDRHFWERYDLALKQRDRIKKFQAFSQDQAAAVLFRMIASYRPRQKNKLALLALLQKPDFNVNVSKGAMQNTALHEAVGAGHVDIVNMLLETPGIDVNVKNAYEMTPLHNAADKGNTDIAKALLNVSGLQINAKSQYNLTPLHLAAKRGHLNMMQLFLDAPDIEINPRNMLGQTPLGITTNAEAMNLLQQNGGVL